MSQLHAFLAVARQRSFHRAAAALHMTQPSVSKTIRQMEEALGVPLFRRTPSGAELTEKGGELLPYVERALAELDMAETLIGDRPSARGRTLAIAAVGPMVVPVLRPALEALRVLRPELHVRWSVVRSDEARRLVREGAAAAALCCSPVTGPRMECERLLAEAVDLYVPARWAGQVRSVDALRDLPWVQYATGIGFRDLVLRFFEQHALDPPMVIEGGESRAVEWLVHHEVGCSFLSVPPGRRRSESGARRLRLKGVPRFRHWIFLAHRTAGAGTDLDAFLAILRSTVQGLRSGVAVRRALAADEVPLITSASAKPRSGTLSGA